MDAIRIPVSFGEIVDKMTILEIKLEKIDDANKRANIARELNALRAVWSDQFGEGFGTATALATQLKDTNRKLWIIEDDIRDCERRQDFDARFIGLARSVYTANDERAAIKSEINRILESPLREEKSYKPYRSERGGEMPKAGDDAEGSDDARALPANPLDPRSGRP